MESKDFWDLCQLTGKKHRMDPILAYMYVMIMEAQRRKMPLSRETFHQQGAEVALFQGINDWFSRVNAYGAKLGFRVEHYVLSSGLKEII